jgi:hypothetical protein
MTIAEPGRLLRRLFFLILLACLPAGPAHGRAEVPADHHVDLTVKGHVFLPPELPAPELSGVKVPAGFKIARFADGLGNVRMLAVSPEGNVYVTLELVAGSNRDEVLAALKGHVLARGELVGTLKRPESPARP